MFMKIRVSTLLASTSFLLTLASLGCGSGSVTPPPTASVAATANPLVAQYNISHFDSGLSAWVEFGTDTNYGRQTSAVASSASGLVVQKLSVLVAGMKPQTTYHMRAHAAWPGGSWVDQDQTFKTGAIPSSSLLPQFTVTQPTANPGSSAGGVELLSMVSSLGTYLSAVATDLQGNVIWFCPGAATPVKQMTNGHYLMNSGTDWIEVDLACNTIRDVSITQVTQALQAAGKSFGPLLAFHHDMLVLPNGHWILLGNVQKAFTDLPGYPGITNVTGDVLMDVDLNGNVVWAWSAFDHLDVNRHLQGLPDWTHSNALQYTADGNLLLSIRHQSWVVKIDYANGAGQGDIIWKLGYDLAPDFTLLGADPSQWFYAQHYPNILSVNGSQTTLAIWDNGNLRLDSNGGDPCGASPAPACYSRATIFQIDESTRLATALWQYLPGYFSNWGGSINVLSNNDVEFNMSNPFNQAASQIEEVTQTDTPQIVWQMTITGEASYRGYRIPSLYPGVTWQK
jgi:arylsulfate sulfotransferase